MSIIFFLVKSCTVSSDTHSRERGFCVNIGPYSKNVIKMHSFCPLVSDKYIIALLNSDFIVSFVKGLITIGISMNVTTKEFRE